MVDRGNPYCLDPVDSPRLLRTRRGEINRVVETIAPGDGRGRHALVVGDERTGRTSLLREAARRASADRGCLVVWLRLLEHDLTTSGLQRALLNATVEALVGREETRSDWYLAWCDRVHLRDRSSASLRDRLVSALVFAADGAAVADRAVFERDLRTLSRMAREKEMSRIVVCIDDADALLEDVSLVENVLDTVTAAGAWSVAMTATPAGSGHLVEAVSPALRHMTRLWLAPFWTPDKIRTCLTAPLDLDDVKLLMPANPVPLIVDLLRLTGGSPFEIAVIARHLWLACRLGEQERYELTPRVLERALSDIASFTGAEAELVAGARAVQKLDPDRVGPALDLLALSELTIREIAIARLLGVPNDDDTVSDRLLTTDLDEEVARVVEELEELERDGVVMLDDDGERFIVQGGHAAVVALKFQVQSHLGRDKIDKPFGIPFLPCVGQPLAEDYARRVVSALPGARRLASSPAFTVSGGSSSARLRAALDTRPFAGLDVDALFADEDAHNRLAELVLNPRLASVVVVDFTLSAADRQLDWIEIWEVPRETELHEVNQCLHRALDSWQQLTLAAGVRWRGSHAVMFRDDDAASALIQLCPHMSDVVVHKAWDEWQVADDGTLPDRVVEIAEMTVAALKAHRVPDWERGWELSTSRSRLGFLLSFYEDRLDRARVELELATNPGPGDGWVTAWNLANVAARTGEHSQALSTLDGIADDVRRARSAHLIFFAPDRSAASSVVAIDAASAAAVFALQRTLIAHLVGEASVDDVRTMIEAAATSGPVGTEVASWVQQAVPAAVPSAEQG